MNAEPPETNEPKPQDKGMPGIIWVLVALSPTLLIMRAFAGSRPGQDGLQIIVYFITPLLSVWGSYGLLKKPERSWESTVIGAVVLGIVFIILDLAIGFFAGCAFGGGGF
jgi:hypothetical protein